MNIIEINSANLLYNLDYHKRLCPNSKICAMVKANAYGHNAIVIANLLSNKVDYFGVNCVKEALELRNAGIKNNILIVGVCEAKDYQIVYDNNIEITIDSWLYLDEALTSELPLKIHFAVNTGMNRLGFCVSDLVKAEHIAKDRLNVKGIFTHFATADSDKSYYEWQLQNFYNALEDIDTSDLIIHASNTSSIYDGRANFDMVRLGIGLYGYGHPDLKPVLKVKSKVVAIHCLSPNTRVGYGNGYATKEIEYIAVVALGYADGVPRNLARKVFVMINDKEYLVVSNICMDMFMVRVDKNVKIGDEVIVMQNAKEWATILNTIPYEILTNIQHRRLDINII